MIKILILFKKLLNFRNGERGAAVLIVTLILLSMAVVFVPALIFLSQANQEIVYNQLKASAAYYAAEAAVEDGVYRVKKSLKYPENGVLNVDGAEAVIGISASSSKKIISVRSQAENRFRKVEAVLEIDGVIAEFHYGVQVGDGGLEMQQGSKVFGSVHSNGNITGTNAPEITGDAFAAASSSIFGMKVGGNIWAYSVASSQAGGDITAAGAMSNSSSSGDVYAANITKSRIVGDATYITIDGETFVGGQRIATTVAPAAPAKQLFPISDSELAAWQAEAAAGGEINSPCPYTISSGSVNLGPVKINCDLRLRLSGTLVLNGPIWVKGNITVENSGVIKLAGYFGSQSSVIIADDPADRPNKGVITIRNSGQFQGSGTAGSYILAASRNNSASGGGSVIAINVGNASFSSIFFAPQGLIQVSNEIFGLKEVTGYKLKMINDSSVVYESGLANLLFTSGPTAGWSLVDWQEKL